MPLTVKDISLGSGVFCGHLTLTPICLCAPAFELPFHARGKNIWIRELELHVKLRKHFTIYLWCRVKKVSVKVLLFIGSYLGVSLWMLICCHHRQARRHSRKMNRLLCQIPKRPTRSPCHLQFKVIRVKASLSATYPLVQKILHLSSMIIIPFWCL